MANSKYSDGIIYKDAPEFSSDGLYEVRLIVNTDLAHDWEQGVIYRIQIRFGSSPLWTNDADFPAWKKNQIENNGLSEWSTVMLIKSIQAPEVIIKTESFNGVSNSGSISIETTTTPIFTGLYTSTAANHESVNQFIFTLYDEEDNQLETSDWLQYEADTGIKYRFKRILENDSYYSVTLNILTVNGYTLPNPIRYNFQVHTLELDKLSSLDFYGCESDYVFGQNNGCVKLYITSYESLNGNYVIMRSSSKDAFATWHDIKYLFYFNTVLSHSMVFADFTIESGVQYKYAISIENDSELTIRSEPLLAACYPDKEREASKKQENYIWEYNFEYSYLYRDGVQLKLSLNQKINSFKHTVLRSKQDTLGGKYPYLSSNGYANYIEFPLSGTITFQMDEDQTFFQIGQDGLYYNNELVLPKSKFDRATTSRPHVSSYTITLDDDGQEIFTPDSPVLDAGHLGSIDYTISTDFEYNNIYVERIFREKEEEFLNDFNYKLYRSATEGNIVVGLLNVSLTPKAELGRMIYDFSATAYQVSDSEIEDLNSAGIIEIGEHHIYEANELIPSFGQIDELYEPNFNLYPIIQSQQNLPIDENYAYQLHSVQAIWIDAYDSSSTVVPQINKLREELAELLIEGGTEEEIEAKENEIAEQEAFEMALRNNIYSKISVAKFLINGVPILVMPGKIYALDEDITSITLISTNYPIVLNYECKIQVVINANKKETVMINNDVVWGQISGVITNTGTVLEYYDYNYPKSSTFRIYNPNPSSNVIKKDEFIVVDSTNYNVYYQKDLDILAIIQQEVKRQIERDYGNIELVDDGEGNLTDGRVYYSFRGLLEYSIEADPGTELMIGNQIVKLGFVPVGEPLKLQKEMHPVFDDNNHIIGYQYEIAYYHSTENPTSIIARQPQFFVINYKCMTREEIKEAVVG